MHPRERARLGSLQEEGGGRVEGADAGASRAEAGGGKGAGGGGSGEAHSRDKVSSYHLTSSKI